jgi:N-acetylglucosamine kinase-like BadF-type ATPase
MTYRIIMHAENDWGFAIGDELSGFSLWGYPTKQAAREAMQAYQ